MQCHLAVTRCAANEPKAAVASGLPTAQAPRVRFFDAVKKLRIEFEVKQARKQQELERRKQQELERLRLAEFKREWEQRLRLAEFESEWEQLAG